MCPYDSTFSQVLQDIYCLLQARTYACGRLMQGNSQSIWMLRLVGTNHSLSERSYIVLSLLFDDDVDDNCGGLVDDISKLR